VKGGVQSGGGTGEVIGGAYLADGNHSASGQRSLRCFL